MAVPRPDAERGVYGISVAADLVGMGVQTLRLYETRGLLEPERTDGGTRRYSSNDLDRLRRIGDLVDAGLNLAGIGMVLDLEAENTQLRTEVEEVHRRSTSSAPARSTASTSAPATRTSRRTASGSAADSSPVRRLGPGLSAVRGRRRSRTP
jgi:MerR family transcriptional regulator/heat shock protein HspR